VTRAARKLPGSDNFCILLSVLPKGSRPSTRVRLNIRAATGVKTNENDLRKAEVFHSLSHSITYVSLNLRPSQTISLNFRATSLVGDMQCIEEAAVPKPFPFEQLLPQIAPLKSGSARMSWPSSSPRCGYGSTGMAAETRYFTAARAEQKR
jgi:hypothetical protein